MSTPETYDFLCSIGELVDKLTIENIKCYDANMTILRERAKDHPDASVISANEFKARSAGEQRCRLKDAINQRIAEAVTRGGIGTAPEIRTYDLGKLLNA